MRLLTRLWAGWQRASRWVGNAAGRVLLTVFYFTVFVPYGVAGRLFMDRLQLKRGAARWRERPAYDESLDGSRRLS